MKRLAASFEIAGRDAASPRRAARDSACLAEEYRTRMQQAPG